MAADPIIGIDLGTTFSAVAWVDEGVPKILENREDGQRTTPSVVYFDPSGVPVVGSAALNVAVSEPDRVVQFVKRSMGSTDYVRNFDGREWTPESISGCILRCMRRQAQEALATEVSRAVISVPAYFKDSARTATIAAAEVAGLEVVALINEPTAAAIAYGLGKAGEHQTLLVYDFGGGTFDVTVLRIDGNEFTVLATDGDASLGGFNINERLVDHLAEAFLERHGVDLRQDRQADGDLWARAEQAKRSLSSRRSVPVTLSHGLASMRVDVERDQFNGLIADLVARTRERTERALASAGLGWSQVDAVLPVGGSCRIPAVRDMLQEVSGKRLTTSVNPDEVVACGAALRAHLAEVTEITRGDPDGRERGGSSGGPAPTGVVVHDVAPHSVGVKATDGTGREVNSVIIPRLTEVPCERVRTYRTVADNQSTIELFVLQGEDPDPFSPEVEPIGRVALTDLPARPAGQVVVSVALRYDANGVIEVEATELEGGRAVRAQLLQKVGELDPELLDAMRAQVGRVDDELPPPGPVDPDRPDVDPDRPDVDPDRPDVDPDRPDVDPDRPAVDREFDYYDFLEVPTDAGPEDIEAAIAGAEARYGAGDRNGDADADADAVRWTRRTLAAARLVLLDPARRAEYDAHRGLSPGSGGAPVGGSPELEGER